MLVKIQVPTILTLLNTFLQLSLKLRKNSKKFKSENPSSETTLNLPPFQTKFSNLSAQLKKDLHQKFINSDQIIAPSINIFSELMELNLQIAPFAKKKNQFNIILFIVKIINNKESNLKQD